MHHRLVMDVCLFYVKWEERERKKSKFAITCSLQRGVATGRDRAQPKPQWQMLREVAFAGSGNIQTGAAQS